MNVVEEAARQAGYAPDCLVTADETGGFGRPWPYMIFENMRLLKLPAVRTVVKIGDTVSDIEEARAAGVWAVGVVDGSSVMGLRTLNSARSRMRKSCGTHPCSFSPLGGRR